MKVTSEGHCRMTVIEYIKSIILWIVICTSIGWLFYGNIKYSIVGWPGYIIFRKEVYKISYKKYNKQLRMDFKDTMLSIYSSLSAGVALEESIRRALEDIERSLKPNSRMILELNIICHKMERNISVVQCLEEMSERCQNAEIENFVQILILAKKQGGNMADLVRDSVDKIQRRIETGYEIEGIIGAKRSEFFFMCVIPAGVILYMRVFSSEFMEVLYGNLTGFLLMSVCLAIYGAAFALGLKILRLE